MIMNIRIKHLLLCCSMVFEAASASYVWNGSLELQLQYVKNVTNLLNSILYGYDKLIRPSENDEPTNVKIDIEIRSMGPISDIDMAYSMDCYFRQTWIDQRLRYSDSSQKVLMLGLSMLDRIWKPDTYFWNGMDSYLHDLTTPNKLVRLYQDGKVLFSSRLTIKAKCPMNLRKYPLDIQRCPLIIGSLAFRDSDVRYEWSKGLNNSVSLAKGVELTQFSLRRTELFNGVVVKKRHGRFSMLELHFLLYRRSGYFVTNFYGPCTLIVILSWVALWLNREASEDRITLGDKEWRRFEEELEVEEENSQRNHHPTTNNNSCYASQNALSPEVLGDISPRYFPLYPNYNRRRKENTFIRYYRKCFKHKKKPNPADVTINSVSMIDHLARVLFPCGFALVSVVYWNSYLNA